VASAGVRDGVGWLLEGAGAEAAITTRRDNVPGGAAVYPDPVCPAGGRVRGTALVNDWLRVEVQSGRYAFELVS
jgi:hypothetical protein